MVARFGDDLPFLFKVLSVQTALSIQAHPDKALAARLHASAPHIYKDANHKPEMAVALSDDFTALAGFVSREELAAALEGVPELSEVMGRQAVESYLAAPLSDAKSALRDLYTALMTAPADLVEAAVGRLVARLSAAASRSSREELALRLAADFPGDVGVLASWFLNHVALPPGGALYLGPNEPHAYLSGELMEVMATSDNVVRAGCTPKLKDVPVLLSMLGYGQGPPPRLDGVPVRPHTLRYAPPMEEFELEQVALPAAAAGELPPVASPGLVLVQGGTATGSAEKATSPGAPEPLSLSRGDVLFVPAGTRMTLAAGSEGATLWAAYVSRTVWGEQVDGSAQQTA